MQRARMALSYVSAKFPAGLEQSRFELSTRLRVFDSLDAERSLFQSVIVEEDLELTTERVQQFFSSAVNNASGFADDIKQAAAISSAVINSVDCSNAPNCTALNRDPCSSVPVSCGPCFSDYIGQSGHHNSPCYSQASKGMTDRRLSGSMLLSEDVVECTVDSDCGEFQWQECREGLCSLSLQRCPNDCSSHGDCKFVSTFDSNITFDYCETVDFHCYAMCDCEHGFNGTDCSTLADEYVAMLDLRHGIAMAIKNISLIEENSRDNIVSWLNGLSALAAKSSDLHSSTRLLIADVVVDIVGSAKAAGLSYEDVSSVANILDLVLPGQQLDDNSEAKVLLKLYGDYIAGDMLVGQNPVSIVSNAFRVSSQALDGSGNVSVSSPVSGMESVFGREMSSATISPCGSMEAFKLVVTESGSSISGDVNASVLSNNFGLNFDVSLGELCALTVTLKFAFPLAEEVVNGTEYVEFECENDLIEQHQYTCESGDVVIGYCNGTGSRRLTRFCPQYHPAAACRALGISPSSCVVVNYTSHDVTCECSASNATQGRRLQENIDDSGDDDAEISFVAIGENLAVEFADTWKSAGDLSASDVTESWQVLVTVVSIGIASVLFMTLGWYTDTHVSKTSRVVDAVDSTDNSSRLSRRFRSLSLFTKSRKSRKESVNAWKRTKSFVMPPEQKSVESALPTVLKPLPVWKKFVIEAQVYHRYWCALAILYNT